MEHYKDELREIDRKSTKIMTMNKELHLEVMLSEYMYPGKREEEA